MVAKKTKRGKLSLTLNFFERDKLFNALINFLESESVSVMFVQLKNEKDIMKVLYYSTLDRFVHNTSFNLLIGSREDKKIIVTTAEAIALMWLLRDHSDMEMINMKSELHKKLS